tara:strand:+ start:8742 stop:9506 length:765 start_codon:yes stop_codon:yes gene_type:complete
MELFDLTEKTALITGGNGGLGLGMAKGLSTHGCEVILVGRNQLKLDSAIEEINSIGKGKAHGLIADVNNSEDLKEVVNDSVKVTGQVDILINNAGISIRKQPEDLSDDDWDNVLNTNLRSVFKLSRMMYGHFKTTGHGKIINIGSMYSIFGSDWVLPYSASKGAIIQLTKSLAVAWAKDNIQVNAIIPGWFETELTASIPTLDPERYNKITNRIPVGKWGTPQEIAGTAVFLSSCSSDYVTGTSVIVDGGYSAS